MRVHVRWIPWLIALAGALYYIPFLGGVHLFDWDEVNFAEISREMLEKRDFLRVYVNFQPFWEKPPFFFWLQSAAMYLFGVGEFGARFPNAVCGILTLLAVFFVGKHLFDTRFGLLWAATYFGAVLPFLYFKSGIIDPFFNLFIFVGLYYFILAYWKKAGFSGIQLTHSQWRYLFWGGFWCGMGILTKGQVAFLISALTMGVYFVFKRFKWYMGVPSFLFFSVSASLVTLAWYGLETLEHGPWFIREFNRYQYRLFSTPDAGHAGFPGYHFAVLLIGCFPASVFALRSFFYLPAENADHRQDFRRWMKMLFWVVLILFSIVQSKIVHYSSMCYFPLTFLAALVFDKLWKGEIRMTGWMYGLLAFIGSLFAAATLAMPFVGRNIDKLKPFFKDPFALANLNADVRWTGFEVIPGIFLFLILVVALWRIRTQQWPRAAAALYGGTAVFVMLTLIFFIRRIEGYSQRPAINFFKEKAGQDVYLTTHGYKSYAHLFYGRVTPHDNPEAYRKDWLLNGPVDKDVYIATKVQRAHELRNNPSLEEIGQVNGFVFFKRPKQNPK